MSRDNHITVKRGQLYRVPRRGKPAAFVRILGVRKGQQPKASYQRVTKSGRKRSEKATAWLQWRDGGWRLPPDWALL